jgi:hypothetical protein
MLKYRDIIFSKHGRGVWSIKKLIVHFGRNCYATETSGHCMSKEMPVIPINSVVDPKRIIGTKWRAKEEERHNGLLTTTPPKNLLQALLISFEAKDRFFRSSRMRACGGLTSLSAPYTFGGPFSSHRQTEWTSQKRSCHSDLKRERTFRSIYTVRHVCRIRHDTSPAWHKIFLTPKKIGRTDSNFPTSIRPIFSGYWQKNWTDAKKWIHFFVCTCERSFTHNIMPIVLSYRVVRKIGKVSNFCRTIKLFLVQYRTRQISLFYVNRSFAQNPTTQFSQKNVGLCKYPISLNLKVVPL